MALARTFLLRGKLPRQVGSHRLFRGRRLGEGNPGAAGLQRLRRPLPHARQNGQRLGRPLMAAVHTDQIRKFHRTGMSKAEIARRLQIGRTSVRRILKERIGQ